MTDSEELAKFRRAIECIALLPSYDKDYDGMHEVRRWPKCDPPTFPGDFVRTDELTPILKLLWPTTQERTP